MRAAWMVVMAVLLGGSSLWASGGQEAVPQNAVRFEGTPVTRARDAALLLSGQDGGGLDVELTLGEPARGWLPATVRFSAAAVPVQVVLYGLRGDEVVASAAHRVGPSSKLDPERSLELRVVLDTALEAPPGPLRVRLLVRSGDAFALRTSTLSSSESEERGDPASPPPEPRIALEPIPPADGVESPEETSRQALETAPPGEVTPPGTAEAEAVVRRLLARADRQGLEALEIQWMVERPEDVLVLLETVYRRLATELSIAEAPALRPLAVAHMERAWSHGEQGRGTLARTAAEQAILAAEAHARLQEGGEGRAWTARLLGVLAGRRLAVGRISAAETLFRRALEWSDEDSASRLGLASILEKTGRFQEAEELLEPLTRSPSASDEIRLRRALCRLRHRPGDRRPFRELRRLSAEARPSWVAVLATQERARLLARRGEADAARELLETAHRRWPEVQGLAVQLARLLDAAGRPGDARRRLLDLPTASLKSRDAPRTRYNRWPMDAIAESRRALVEAARLHRPSLVRALAVEPTAEPS